MNYEVRYSIIIIFVKRLSAAIPPFIIRNFLFDILRFAVPTMCVSYEDPLLILYHRRPILKEGFRLPKFDDNLSGH
jgi:hypothetical protein